MAKTKWINIIGNWFQPPIFLEDEDKTRNARVLSALLLSMLLFLLLAILGVIFVFVNKLGASIIILALIGSILVTRTLMNRGQVLVASRLFVIGMWVIFSLLFVSTGKFNSVGTNLLMATTVMTGVLLGRQSALVVAVSSSLLGLGMAILENTGFPFLRFFLAPPIPSWVTWTLTFFLILPPINIAIQDIINSRETLRESEEHLNYVLEGGQLCYWNWNIETGQVKRNARWAEMLGYTLSEVESTFGQWIDLHHPDDRDRVRQSIQDHLDGRKNEHKAEYRIRMMGGQYKWVLDQAKVVKRDSQGRPLRMSGTHTDITPHKLAEEEEHRQRILAEAISNSAAALNGTLDFEGVINRIVDNVGRVVSHDASNIMLLEGGDVISVACHRGYIERGIKADEIERQFSLAMMPILIEAARTGKSIATPDTHTDKGWVTYSSTQWVRSNITVPIQIRKITVGFLNLDSAKADFFSMDHAEKLQTFASHAAIAIENARLYEEVRKLAATDILTGIYNRAFFETELVRIGSGRDFPVSIMVADLDNLKITNDTLGHAVGDKILKHTAWILQDVFRNSDIVARIGGDEFAVLLPKTGSETTKKILHRIRAELQKHNVRHPDLQIGLSIGMATAKSGSLQETLVLADRRMYKEKSTHK